MAQADDRGFDQLLSRIERREATARRRTLVLSLVPIAVGVIVLGGTALGVRALKVEAERSRLDARQAQLEAEGQRKAAEEAKLEAGRLRETVTALNSRVAALEQQLQRTTDLARFRHDIDLTDLKMVASRYPGPARALDLILQLRERRVGWHLGGRSPEQGFDSPGFAVYVLSQVRPGTVRGLAPGGDLMATSQALMTALPRAAGPGVGDLVFYPAGYALFRFEDRRGQPFVIGMTPQGIIALAPGFSQPIGAGRISW